MNQPELLVADGVAVLLLAFALYFPRHHRRDMVVALLGVNVGVLAVASVLLNANVTAGLGLGLFGVLSIIRLRSSELDQEEIVYYFASLALGMLGGIEVGSTSRSITLMGVVLLALFIGDHPRLLARNRSQVVTLDRAYADEAQLTARIESLLDARVLRLKVRRLDLVNDTTVVDVRYRLRS